MADRVKGVHAGGVIGHRTGQGQRGIDTEQNRSGGHDARRQASVFHGAWGFSAIQLHPADTQERQHRHGQYDDPDAPHPLQQLTIKQQRFGQIVQTRDHRSACRGQATDGFENGVCYGQI